MFTSTPIKLFHPKIFFSMYTPFKPSWYKCSSWLFVETKHVFRWRGLNLPISRRVIGHLPWILPFHWLLVVIEAKRHQRGWVQCWTLWLHNIYHCFYSVSQILFFTSLGCVMSIRDAMNTIWIFRPIHIEQIIWTLPLFCKKHNFTDFLIEVTL